MSFPVEPAMTEAESWALSEALQEAEIVRIVGAMSPVERAEYEAALRLVAEERGLFPVVVDLTVPPGTVQVRRDGEVVAEIVGLDT